MGNQLKRLQLYRFLLRLKPNRKPEEYNQEKLKKIIYTPTCFIQFTLAVVICWLIFRNLFIPLKEMGFFDVLYVVSYFSASFIISVLFGSLRFHWWRWCYILLLQGFPSRESFSIMHKAWTARKYPTESKLAIALLFVVPCFGIFI